MFYTDPHCTCAFSHRVVRGIYTYRRVASALLVQTGLGNAKASMRGTGNRYGLPALFSYMYQKKENNLLFGEFGSNIENQFIMRKVMFKWLAMLLAVVFCTGFVSCKDDDDDDNGASGNSIVGTWRMDFSVGYELMTFRSDGTGILIEYDWESGSWNETFAWVQNDRTVILMWDDGYTDEYYNVSVTSTKLTWTYDDGHDGEVEVWTRQQ